MSINKKPIPHRVYNPSSDHPYVAGAVDIIDDAKNKHQQKINAETDSSLANHQQQLNNKYNKDEVYRKDETYSKEQLNNLITTPEQEYVTVTADDQTVDVTDILPETGEADTVYRVGNWDGEQYDPTVYSEYAWDGTQYQFLDKKEYTLATAEDFIEPDATKRAKVVPVGAAADIYGSYKDNPEYIELELDAEEKVLGGRKKDGKKFENVGLEIGNRTLYPINDPEGRIEIEMDANNKIYSYRDKDGILHENVGISINDTIIKAQEGENISEIADNGDKLLSFREKDGTLVEKVGIKTPFVKITGSKTTDILNLYPRERMLPILKNYKYSIDYTNYQPYTPLTLIHFSDVHESVENLQRIKEFYDKYGVYVDDVVFTGDVFLDTFNANIFSKYWNYCKANNFLFVVGNHDACTTLSPYTPVSPKMEYDTFIKPFLAQTNVNSVENKCYWYKDYTDAKSPECQGGIRLIALDQYHWYERETIGDYVNPTYPDGTSVDTGQQEAWLEGLLNDALTNGYAVITALHSPVNPDDTEEIDCTFNALNRNNTAPYSWIPQGMLSKIQDFIDAGGEFICWMLGHQHEDWFCKIANYPKQVMMVISTASYHMANRRDYMLYDTYAMDRFNLFSVEPVMKLIRLYRVGAEYDRHGRHIGTLVYDYKNQKVISNY